MRHVPCNRCLCNPSFYGIISGRPGAKVQHGMGGSKVLGKSSLRDNCWFTDTERSYMVAPLRIHPESKASKYRLGLQISYLLVC